MMRKLRFWTAGVVMALSMGTPLVTAALLGTGFNYQGQLKQAGLPVNGTCDIQFSLWDDAVNAGLSHRLGAVQTIVGTEVSKGQFSVELNSGGEFGGNAFNGDARWLELSVRCPTGVGSFSPLSPRQKVSPVPYALKVPGVDGHSLDAADGTPTDVVYVNNGGNVGVGTTTPAHKLDLRGDLKGNGRVGLGGDSTIGPAGGYDTIFDFSHTITDFSTANNWSPFRSYITLDPNVSLIPGAIYGHDLETTIADGNKQNFDFVFGPYLGAFHLGDGDVNYLGGVDLVTEHFGPGTVSYQHGAYVVSDIGVTGTGTIMDNYGVVIQTGAYGPGGEINNNYSLWIDSPGNTRPIQNHYGIYLNNQDFGEMDSFAIYSAGGKSYFQDQVGIGTDNPQAMLHIGGTPGVDGIRFPDGTLQTTAAIGGGGGDSVWSLNGANAYYNAGKVGVGTASPGMSLEVSSPSYYGKPAIGAADGPAYTYLHVTSSTDHSLVWDDQRAMRFGTETGRGTGYGERMRINADGTVGVGTQTPGAKFEAFARAGAGNGTVAVKGTTEPSFDLFGNFFQGGIGVWGDAPSNIGVLGTSTESYGVKGESTNNDGVHGVSHHTARSGVWGHNDSGGGHGVSGSTTGTGYAGVYGSGSVNGVVGETGSGSASGVYGQNNGSGWGMAGYAAGALVGEGRFGGTGVEGISDGLGGYGVIGRAHGLNGVGIHAEAQNGSATALWAYNPGGRSALLEGYVDVYGALNVSGSASVRILTITGGADLAEPFDISPPDSTIRTASGNERTDGATEPGSQETTKVEPGMVVVIDPDQPGKLKVSSESYDRKVAGVISGANSLSPGMVMRATDHPSADGEHPVALTGRVWCHCDATTNAIVPGDMLTSSDTPGFAMKATDIPRAQGASIGKAMTSLKEGQTGLVLVLVNLQ